MITEQTEIFRKWFKKLSSNVQDKIMSYIDRYLTGNSSNCKSIGNDLYEIKINYQKGYRVYFTHINNRIVMLLLCGGNKDTQTDDIDKAIAIKTYVKGKYGK